MTNKQIINGVDVNGCQYNEGDFCLTSRHAYCFCTNKPNCIYKRLKRKEQKNEKLEYTLVEIKEIAEKHKATAHCDYLIDMDKILQKISECEVE